MKTEETGKICDREKAMESFSRSKHHAIKILIAIIVIPLLTMLLDRYVLGGKIPVLVVMAASIGVTYVLLTVYDTIIIRESEKMLLQLNKNTEDIVVIKEDIKDLQSEVYREGMDIVRAENWIRAKERQGGLD